MQPWFFDCLHRDGVDLVDEPLSTRREVLAEVVGDRLIPGVVRPTVAEAEQAVADALAAGQEGSMVKALDSTYSAGRRGRSWQKVKPSHTLDLVVLGVEWGSGRRRGWLSNIHLGARDGDGRRVRHDRQDLQGHDRRRSCAGRPRRSRGYETHRDDWTLYLRPEIVVEIELDGVQTSTRYPGGVALRFARVVRYRDDKTAAEADTLETVRALKMSQRTGGSLLLRARTPRSRPNLSRARPGGRPGARTRSSPPAGCSPRGRAGSSRSTSGTTRAVTRATTT